MLGLAFSGGKDSLACWYLYKAKKPIVFWANTGKNYPETLKIVDEIRNECVEFIEVLTDQQKQIDEEGYPSDLVPVERTIAGMETSGIKQIKVQSYLNCCFKNISFPIFEAANKRGISELIQGQRNDDSLKAPLKNGDVVAGIKLICPLQDWTKEQVMKFISANRAEMPEHYKFNQTSLDCYDCTAYLEQSKDRTAWAKEAHPELYGKYKINLDLLKIAIADTWRHYESDC